MASPDRSGLKRLAEDRTPIVLRSELTKAFLDPPTAPALRAYVPELHASSRCPRALPKGRSIEVGKLRIELVWCITCTTDDPERATLRRTRTGWEPVPKEEP